MPVITYTAASTALVAKSRHVRVRAWGAGGTGGPAQGTGSTTGGGAGGAFTWDRRQLTPGTSYTVVVGQASAASATAAVAGGDTTFNSTDVIAKGGPGSAVNAAASAGSGVAGTTTGCVPSANAFKGGDGATAPSASVSGGGGGGADDTGAGNNASGQTAGAAKGTFGGLGGVGVSVTNTRTNGSNYAAGGSGAYTSATQDRTGGNGASGLAIVDYVPPCTGMLLGVGI